MKLKDNTACIECTENGMRLRFITVPDKKDTDKLQS